MSDKHIAHFDHHHNKDDDKSDCLYFDAKDIIYSNLEISDERGNCVGVREKDGKKGLFPRSYVGVLDKEGNLECVSCKEYGIRLEKAINCVKEMEMKIAAVADEIYMTCLARFRGIRKSHVEDQCKIKQLRKSVSHLKEQLDNINGEKRPEEEEKAEIKQKGDGESTQKNKISPSSPRLRSMTKASAKEKSPRQRRLTQRYFAASEEFIRQQANTAMLGWQLKRIEQVTSGRSKDTASCDHKNEKKENVEEEKKEKEEEEEDKQFTSKASSVTSSASSSVHFDSTGNMAAFPGAHDSQSTTASSVHFEMNGNMAAFPGAHDSQSSAYTSSASTFRSTNGRLYPSNASAISHISTSSNVLPSSLSPRQRATEALKISILREKSSNAEYYEARFENTQRRLNATEIGWKDDHDFMESRIQSQLSHIRESEKKFKEELAESTKKMRSLEESEARLVLVGSSSQQLNDMKQTHEDAMQRKMEDEKRRAKKELQEKMEVLSKEMELKKKEMESQRNKMEADLERRKREMEIKIENLKEEKKDFQIKLEAQREEKKMMQMKIEEEKNKIRLSQEKSRRDQENLENQFSGLEDTIDRLKISIETTRLEKDALEAKLMRRSDQHENDLERLDAERRRAAEADLRARMNLETTKNIEFMLHDEYVLSSLSQKKKTHTDTRPAFVILFEENKMRFKNSRTYHHLLLSLVMTQKFVSSSQELRV